MKILFFDGYCSLCNGLVDWLIKRDRKGVIKFASLQGITAGQMVPQNKGKIDFDTVVYFREGRLYERSEAILRLLEDLGGGWKAVRIFFILPAFLRDSVYRFVASNRYRFFRKRDTCRMPTLEEKERMLP